MCKQSRDGGSWESHPAVLNCDDRVPMNGSYGTSQPNGAGGSETPGEVPRQRVQKVVYFVFST